MRATKTRRELVGLYRTPVPQTGRYGRLRLDKNENTVGFPRAVIRRLLAGIGPHFLAAYPEPGPLYAKLARWHRLKTENVLVTAGSEMAIRYLFEAYLDRGDEVVFLNPSFAMFDVYARLCGAKRVTVDCGPDLAFSTDAILESITRRTKIVALANPNNPTGSVVPERDFLRILRRAASVGALVLSDEAYYYFHDGTMLPRLRRHPNLVVTRTFSKACGLASVRLGYLLAHARVVAEVRKLQPIDHASAFALKCGEYVVDHDRLIRRYAAQVAAGKAFLRGAARRLGFAAPDSHGNFLLIDLGDRQERFLAESKRRGILVGASVRLPFPNAYVRVTVGPVAQMRRVVAALRAVAGRGR